ncbi:MAG: YjdF family protein, partial [Raoultibacter sp.]
MQVNSSSTLTILHDGQFWIAICERAEAGLYGARRIVFGPHEPTDEQIFAFVCASWHKIEFTMFKQGYSAKVNGLGDDGSTRKINPKRQQRLVHRHVKQTGIGTEAQQAIRESYEQSKIEHTDEAKERRQLEAS